MFEKLHVHLERVLETGMLDLGLRALGLDHPHGLLQFFRGELGAVDQLVHLGGVGQGLEAGHDVVTVLDLAFLRRLHYKELLVIATWQIVILLHRFSFVK